MFWISCAAFSVASVDVAAAADTLTAATSKNDEPGARLRVHAYSDMEPLGPMLRMAAVYERAMVPVS